jgi:hypothetical protein
LKPPIGTRVIDSTPAQTKASPAFHWMAPAAMWIACIDEPQKRLTVAPETDSGSSARKPTKRATLNPCSASGKAQPTIRSSMSAGATPVRAIRARTTCAAMSSGRTLASSPFLAGVNGDRA